MKSSELVSLPVSVLVGSAIISLSILVSGGVINLRDGRVGVGSSGSSTAPQAAQPQAQAKGEKEIVSIIKSYATRLGLDQEKFNSCLESGANSKLVQADLNDGTQAGVNGTPSFFINGRLIPGAAPYSNFQQIINEELGVASPSAGINRVTVALGNLPPKGDTNAPVKIVEFSDYQCPFCERFFTQTEPPLFKDYVDTGKVVFYYRDFPLTQIHPGAQKGAEAVRCAGDQGKYWPMHDLLFSNQNSIFY